MPTYSPALTLPLPLVGDVDITLSHVALFIGVSAVSSIIGHLVIEMLLKKRRPCKR